MLFEMFQKSFLKSEKDLRDLNFCKKTLLPPSILYLDWRSASQIQGVWYCRIAVLYVILFNPDMTIEL